MRLAVIGTGMIVHEAFVGLQQVPDIEVVALFCRQQSMATARRLAEEYDVARIYTDYDELLAQQDIDFVYIGLINSVHYEYSRKALLARKNVIIEKPVCLNEMQTADLVAIAREQHLYMFEAVTFLHAPFYSQMKELLLALGAVKMVQCNYSKYSSRYDRYLAHDITPVFDPLCGGGALYDLNIYNLHFVVGLFGLPLSVRYIANKGYNGVDTSGIALLAYPQLIAECVAAKDSYSPCFMLVQGEKGWLKVSGSPDKLQKLQISLPGESREVSLLSSFHRMVDEFTDFEQIYRAGDYARMNIFLEHSLNVIKVAEAARRDANIPM